ncbi:efflux RND transporter periplasmic adaptor subunit [Orrella sp. JC864]|uniref:efflux RND transporter periplasmic adaptor subunit n=1 Tax=Orrella sp. JC864 TaxID=3120298 RepID=UPI00300A4482
MTKHWMTIAGAAALLGLAGCGDGGDTPAPAREDAAAQAGAASQADTRIASVHAMPVQRRTLQPWIYSQGTARSRQREFLTFTQQGMVTYVDESLRVGSPVKAGQLIAHQAPERVQAELQAARAAVAEAQANLALAEVTRQRYEVLISQRSASKQELDQAVVQIQQARAARDSARAQLAQAQVGVDESRLVSPIDGVLARLNIEKGRYFMPSTLQTNTEQNALRTVPALVIDPDRFEVRVDLPSYDFRRIQAGARAVIGADPPQVGQGLDPLAREGQVQGRVYAVSPSLDPETRTFQVIVHTEGTGPGLQDGEFVAVWIAEPAAQDALAVPLDALRFRNDQSFVFVVDPASGKVAERRVELGQQSGNHRQVTEGVQEGELVVTDGRAVLHDGQQVRLLQRGGHAP